MLAAPAGKGSFGRPGWAVRVTLTFAAMWVLPSTARGMWDEPAEDAAKVRLEGVVVRPVNPQKLAGEPVTVILGETGNSRRELVVALPVGAGSKASGLEARTGTVEIERSLIGQAERYDEWVRGGLREGSLRTPGGIVVMEQVLSSLDISCPREVPAGETITLEVTGVGDAVDTWDVWLVYPAAGANPGDGPTPDGSRYDQQTLKAGAKAGGAEKLTATFNTFPADRGRLLGVCIARSESEEKRVLWVQVK